MLVTFYAIIFSIIISPSSTPFGEIGFVYLGFEIIIAIDLRKPYAKPESGANLVKLMKVMMGENQSATTGPCDSDSGYYRIVARNPV
jgi:hypothetical protein